MSRENLGLSRLALSMKARKNWDHKRAKGALRPVSTQENKHRIGTDWTLFHLVLSTPLDEKC